MTFTDSIIQCIENESFRSLLKGIPVWVVASQEYKPPWWFWIDFERGNKN